jgi:hypothetical protein
VIGKVAGKRGPWTLAFAGLALGLVLGGGAVWIVPRLSASSAGTGVGAHPGASVGANPSASVGANTGANTGATSSATGVRIAAVGDMACEAKSAPANSKALLCRQQTVSDAVLAANPSLMLALGDLQYEQGAPGKWDQYNSSYGRLKTITRPAPGNHEYLTPGAAGYYAYFPEWAGPSGNGYYSFDVGGWHVVSLNSECADAGGCGPGSPQYTWLKSDLDSHRTTCTLAFWHIPRFSSGEHGDHTAYGQWWQLLQGQKADLVLTGHDHDYERFAKLNADGQPDDQAGLRSFVVGTGGRNLRVGRTPHVGSEKFIDDAMGFMELQLRPDSYSWRFLSIDGTALDQGEERCH